MKKDKIIMQDMKFYGYHGVLDFETRDGQDFIVSVELSLDLGRAGQSDDLTETINYAEVYELVKGHVEGKPYQLIESLAENIARGILNFDGRIVGVKVRLEKPQAPIEGDFAYMAVEIIRHRWVRAYLSLGSNLGNRAGNLQAGIVDMERKGLVKVLRQAKVYETKPVGILDQGDFLNTIVEIETNLSARDLLVLINSVEASLGRVRSQRWGPRILDIDIIFYGDELISDIDLFIPHVLMGQRAFVLKPLMDLVPDMEHPILGLTVRELYQRLGQAERDGVKEV